MDPDQYEIANIGRLASYWHSKKETVRIVMLDGDVCLELEDWTEEPTVSELSQLLEDWQARSGPLTKEQILFILNTAAAVENHLENAQQDLARYGAISVSY